MSCYATIGQKGCKYSKDGKHDIQVNLDVINDNLLKIFCLNDCCSHSVEIEINEKQHALLRYFYELENYKNSEAEIDYESACIHVNDNETKCVSADNILIKYKKRFC